MKGSAQISDLGAGFGSVAESNAIVFVVNLVSVR